MPRFTFTEVTAGHVFKVTKAEAIPTLHLSRHRSELIDLPRRLAEPISVPRAQGAVSGVLGPDRDGDGDGRCTRRSDRRAPGTATSRSRLGERLPPAVDGGRVGDVDALARARHGERRRRAPSPRPRPGRPARPTGGTPARRCPSAPGSSGRRGRRRGSRRPPRASCGCPASRLSYAPIWMSVASNGPYLLADLGEAVEVAGVAAVEDPVRAGRRRPTNSTACSSRFASCGRRSAGRACRSA